MDACVKFLYIACVHKLFACDALWCIFSLRSDEFLYSVAQYRTLFMCRRRPYPVIQSIKHADTLLVDCVISHELSAYMSYKRRDSTSIHLRQRIQYFYRSISQEKRKMLFLYISINFAFLILYFFIYVLNIFFLILGETEKMNLSLWLPILFIII